VIELTDFCPAAITLRLDDVTVSRVALESTLGVTIDRYEPGRDGTSNYAQLDLPTGTEPWPTVVERLHQFGPKVENLIAGGSIGSASLDLAVLFFDEVVAKFVTLPSHVAGAAGRYGISIELSIYRTSRDA
jgi:hypothetical protein